MNKKITLKRLVASIFMILTAAVMMNAQTDSSWCVVAHDNGKEVGWHSVNVITDIQVTSQSATFVLTDGKTFPYPITSTTFTFEQRAGNGTAIEVINAPKWNVYYNGSSLHFTESVNSVAVYSVSGILIAKVSGNYTDVPVNLAKGIYIVQAGGKTVKLLVTNNGSGAAYAQPTVAESAPQVSYAPSASSSPVTLRSANAAVVKEYWNIHYANMVMPIEIAQINNFYFMADNAIVFVMNNGTIIKLDNYQSTAYSAQPAQSTSNWDMDLTMKFGGASYVINGPYEDAYDMCVVAVAKDYVVAEGVLEKIGNIKISKKDITNPNFWTAKLTIFYYSAQGIEPTLSQCYDVFEWGDWWFYYDAYYLNNKISNYSTRKSMTWSFNNNQPFIQTSIELKADRSLTMLFVDVRDSKAYSYTFPAP